MKTVITLTALTASLILMLACAEEARYKGKSVSEWIELADDLDRNTRESAEYALIELSETDTRAREIMTKRGNEKADDLYQRIQAWAGDASILDAKKDGESEFVEACFDYDILTLNHLIDKKLMRDIGLSLKSILATPHDNTFNDQIFNEYVKPVLEDLKLSS